MPFFNNSLTLEIPELPINIIKKIYTTDNRIQDPNINPFQMVSVRKYPMVHDNTKNRVAKHPSFPNNSKADANNNEKIPAT